MLLNVDKIVVCQPCLIHAKRRV